MQIGMIGLGAMGRNLLLNMADHGGGVIYEHTNTCQQADL